MRSLRHTPDTYADSDCDDLQGSQIAFARYDNIVYPPLFYICQPSRKEYRMSANFRNNFTFGSSVAESDHLLSSAYWDNGDFEAISSGVDFRCFIVGRTGSGKSAAFKLLEEKQPSKVVRIVPENLSLPYITNLDVTRQLLDLGVRLEPFFKALWKHVFVVEVIKHRYNIDSVEKKNNILSEIKRRLSSPTKIKALAYLEEFGDKFWSETDERVKQIAESFERKILASGSLDAAINSFGLKSSGEAENKTITEIKREVASKYQRIVNETQLPRLNEMIVILNNEILDSPQHFTYLIIDDLDKEWVDESLANQLIRCLFEAVLDMQQIKNLKILVALRSNIFQQLNYGDQMKGGQEEKFRSHTLNIRWNRNDLQNLLETRARAACIFYGLEPPKPLVEMLPKPNRTDGEALSYILGRTLMRPRDAILYLNTAVREATGKDRMTWENLRQAEKRYSEERLLALRDEWKDPYFGIDKIFALFRGKSSRMSREEMTTLLDEVAYLIADPSFQGTPWLTELSSQIWEIGSTERSWEELYMPLIELLFRISFLGLTKTTNGRAIYSYEEGKAEALTELSEIQYFDVHPAFRQALDVTERRD